MHRNWKQLLDGQTLAQLQDHCGLSESATAWCTTHRLRTLRRIRIAAGKPGGLRALEDCTPGVEAELLALLPANAAVPSHPINGLGVPGTYAALDPAARTLIDLILEPDDDLEDLDRIIYSDFDFGWMRHCGIKRRRILDEWRVMMREVRSIPGKQRHIRHIDMHDSGRKGARGALGLPLDTTRLIYWPPVH